MLHIFFRRLPYDSRYFLQAHEVAERLGCNYYACSALDKLGLRNIFDEAVRAVLRCQDTTHNHKRYSSGGKGNNLLRNVLRRSRSLQYLNCSG